MITKGELNSTSLPDLLAKFSTGKTSGLLQITSAMGEKTISLTKNEITIFCDPLVESPRFGEILIARGLISDTQMAEALMEQKKSETPMRLGDVLAKLRFVAPDKINEIIRFQMQEELWDLFTWTKASYEFQANRTPNEVMDGFDASRIHKLIVDSGTFVSEIAAKFTEWAAIRTRLPTPYLCFKLTTKGEEAMPNSPASHLRILKLIKEGRTIESVVKRSCHGRFNVCNVIIKLLDDDLITPYPVKELHFLAAEHQSRKRYADALYIYQRLIENADDKEKRQLTRVIDELKDTIRNARGAGELQEETAERKRENKREQMMQTVRRLTMAGFLIASAVTIYFLLMERNRPKASLPESYTKACTDSDAAQAENKYDQAISVWEGFRGQLDPKQTDLAQRVKDRIKALEYKRNAYLEDRLLKAGQLLKADKLDEAAAAFGQLADENGDGGFKPRVERMLAEVMARRNKKVTQANLENLKVALKQANDLLAAKQFTRAKAEFAPLASAAGFAEIQREAEAGMRQIQLQEDRCAEAIRAADRELADHRAEAAIPLYERVFTTWPDFDSAKSARDQAQRLAAKQKDLETQLQKARELEAAGLQKDAIESFRNIERQFGEFSAVDAIRAKLNSIATQTGDREKRLADARKMYESGEYVKARDMFMDLIKTEFSFLEQNNVDVPFFVTSNPTNATLKINGKVVGTTPQRVMVPATRPLSVRIEMDGYAAGERNFQKLPEDLETIIKLSALRAPIATLNVKDPVFAPPVVLGDKLYVLAGTSLFAFDPAGKQQLWNKTKLFDDNQTTRQVPGATGPAEFISHRSFWHPREAPVQTAGGTIILTFRTGEFMEIDPQKPDAKKMFLQLPAEPVGMAHFEHIALLAKQPHLAACCADGKLRIYKMDRPGAPQWTIPVDPDAGPPKGAPAAGVARYTGTELLTLSASGKLSGVSFVTGERNWIHDFRGVVTGNSILPKPNETTAVIVFKDGRAALFDFQQRALVWELPVAQALEEVQYAGRAGDSVILCTREGVIKKASAERGSLRPVIDWQRALDGVLDCQFAVGNSIFAATNNTIYALDINDGRVLWDYHVEGKPTALGCSGTLLYICVDGKVLVMNAG